MATNELIVSAAQSVNFDSAPHLEAPCWYAIYTRARHEKRVAEELTRRAIETYLPLYETARQWKNGRHFVQMPLFSSYAFVRVAMRDRLEVLRAPGVVDFVGISGKPVPLDEEEIKNLNQALRHGRRVEPHPFLTTGRKVRVTAGPLAGLRGIIVRRKGQMHIVVSLDLIQRSVLVEVDLMELEPLVN